LITNLTTNAKDTIVSAINEIVGQISNINTKVIAYIENSIGDLDNITDVGFYKGHYYVSPTNSDDYCLIVSKKMVPYTHYMDAHTEYRQTQFSNGSILVRSGLDIGHGITWEEWVYSPTITEARNEFQQIIPTNYVDLVSPQIGQQAWDSITNKPVWHNGTAWIYADGTEV